MIHEVLNEIKKMDRLEVIQHGLSVLILLFLNQGVLAFDKNIVLLI